MAGIQTIRQTIREYLASMGFNPSTVRINEFDAASPDKILDITGEFNEYLGKSYRFTAKWNNNNELLVSCKVSKIEES